MIFGYFSNSITLRSAILLMSLPVVFSACRLFGDDKKDQGNNLQYALPLPGPIDTGEAGKMAAICEQWYNMYLKNSGFSGGMLVAKSGNVIFEKYNGTAHQGQKDTINSTTPLHIASVSKTFTAMSVLKLWQDKLIDLNDAYSKYFPEFNYPGVTIRSLLSHRSGLPNYTYFMDELGWDRKKFVSNPDVLNTLIQQKSKIKNINPPEKHFSYCNTNYVLLALLVEKVSKLPFPEYLKSHIFDPNGMTHTFVYSDKDSSRCTPSYNWRGFEEAFINLDKVYGDKNVFSTPEDLFKWDRLLYTNQFLSPATLQEAYKPYSNEKPGIRNYGLGWRMYNMPDSLKIIYHNGWWHGSNAVFIRLIQQDATIILIGNHYDRNIYKARDLIGLFVNSLASDNEEE